MRKSYNLLFSLLLVTITTKVIAQLPQITPHAPEIASALQFEEIPVGLYTGVPNIAIPLYNVQTLSKNIAIDLTYRYHPAAVSKYIGGYGWSMNKDCFISRKLGGNPDSYPPIANLRGDDLYQYSFLGNSGRFIINRNSANQLEIVIIETKSGSPYIKIEAQLDSTYQIESFTICDEHGHKYTFGIYGEDIYYNWQALIPNIINGYRSVFYLTEVSDVNLNPIINYVYDTNTVTFTEITLQLIKNKLKSINIAGKGKVIFKEAGKDAFDVVNVHNDSIKKVKFTRLYNEHTIIEKNFKDQQELVHKFYYKPRQSPIIRDMFGYPKGECKEPPIDARPYDADPEKSTEGILQKIVYPGGGYSKFEFESNTFAGSGNNDAVYNELPYNNTPHIIYPSPSQIQIINGFTINEPKTVYATITNPPIYFDTGFYIGNQPYIITESTVSLNGHILKENQAKDNYCFGKKIALPGPATNQTSRAYGLVIDPPNPELTLVVKELIPNAEIKKWYYGGGNRIKKISFYDGITKNSLGEDIPVKETNYGYNFFNDHLRSSGSLVMDFDPERYESLTTSELVGYKNVTVSETGKGRTEHTFLTAVDFPVFQMANHILQHNYDYKRGLETKRTVYDSDNNKLLEAITAYEYHESNDTIHDEYGLPTNQVIYERNGFVKKSTTATTEFFKLGNIWKSIANTEITEIDLFRRLFRKTVEGGGDQFVTRYDYFENLNPCVNRYDVNLVEQFKNNSIVSAQKTIYGTFPGSVYQMPLFMQSGKNLADVESIVEYLSYNHYRNPIEVRRVGGISTIYLWGYNYNIPFAVIENATYSSLSQTLINAARVATDGNNQTQIDTAIANLRADLESSQPNARITTFTYESLVGIKSITDPQGYTTKYEYDGFGRLIAVRDNDNNLVSENKYYFKP